MAATKPPKTNPGSSKAKKSALKTMAVAEAAEEDEFIPMVRYDIPHIVSDGVFARFDLRGFAGGKECFLTGVVDQNRPLIQKMMRAMANAWPNSPIMVKVGAGQQIEDVRL